MEDVTELVDRDGGHLLDSYQRNQKALAVRASALARQERAESWIATTLAGQTFHSYEALYYSALKTYETLRARPCTDEERTILSNASRAVFAGLSVTRPLVRYVGSVIESVTFRAA